jgi:protein involved in polysaccharide export with SLBB domain
MAVACAKMAGIIAQELLDHFHSINEVTMNRNAVLKPSLITFFSLVAVFFVLTGCSSGPLVSNPAPVPQLDKQAQAASMQEYRITRGDMLDIKFLYNPELNEQVPVRPDGRISLQIVKDVPVVGLTPAELTNVLTERYAAELKKPEITVIVRQFTSAKVFVDGEVSKRGLLPLAYPMTVFEAIAQAGGFTEYARQNEIILIRRYQDKAPKITVVDMEKFLNGADFGQDIMLAPYDIVFVPKSPIGNVNTWVDHYIRRMLPFPLPSPVPSPSY